VFMGDRLSLPEYADTLKPSLNAKPGGVVFLRAHPSADKKTWRILFEIDPGNEIYSEMRLVLEAAGKPLSETWLYRWTL
ncbi:MAG TPA: glucan biosynthesis protein, partial [Methylocella sp.]|nr:glucan biosynthesis protein [Methylocella sp.]